MANISLHERQTKAQCLWDAFETLKNESKRKNLVSMKAVIELANQDERMKEFGTDIGEKSVYTKAKGSVYTPIVEAVNTFIKEFKADTEKAGNRSKEKLKSFDSKLASAEAAVILLQEKVHELQARLENKDRIIQQIEEERSIYADEVYRLRRKYEHG
ncbi:hypothetical protein [Sulfuricurvum sp.]|uniref:hypothetical protein n=1 Tax=Sulfuricurvum sp. TaxID=2025608 RepID=UPI00260EB376|nr:hypothetical protein [Sulfuricurvum sp.]MDD2265466.1 hypothetical protein [Sulfuricurvum sp.]MDD2782877.1 hypothetical protein [Sulfuricurvum sp.]